MRYFTQTNKSNITYTVCDYNRHIEINYIFTNVKTEHIDITVFEFHDMLTGNFFFHPRTSFYMEYDKHDAKRIFSAELFRNDFTDTKNLVDNALKSINNKCHANQIERPDKQLVNDFYDIDFITYMVLMRGV